MTAVGKDAFDSSSQAAVSETRAVEKKKDMQSRVVWTWARQNSRGIGTVGPNLVAQVPHTTGAEPEAESKTIFAAVVGALKRRSVARVW
eukprot:3679516-Amphidinium_carterae.1